jgi:predicted P-loop ATPase
MVNPVVDYFDGLPAWDLEPRLDTMMHKYLGADDTKLNAAIGRKLMGAIVRRGKHPGCKWDYEPMLQGPQGIRKSMWCEDLAVDPDLFTDASIS